MTCRKAEGGGRDGEADCEPQIEGPENSKRVAAASIGISVECLNVRKRFLIREWHANEKAPCERRWGSKTAPFLAKDAIPAAREGSLAYGFSADYSGGDAGGLDQPPRFPCLHNYTMRICRA